MSVGAGVASGAAAGSLFGPVGTLIGAGLGAGLGLYQNIQRRQDSERDYIRANLMYEQAVKEKKANRSILEGQLTIGAMQNTANSRESAIQVAQNKAAQQVALGQSGMSGGTPFYALDSQVQQDTQKLAEIMTMQRTQFSGQVAQANAQLGSMDMNVQNAMWQLQDVTEQMNYLESPLAAALSMGTGMLAGATTANNLINMGTQMGMDKWFQKDPSIAAANSLVGKYDTSSETMRMANNRPSQYASIAPSSTASFSGFQPYNQPQDLLKTGGINLMAFDYFGTSMATPKGIGSDSQLGKPLLQF